MGRVSLCYSIAVPEVVRHERGLRGSAGGAAAEAGRHLPRVPTGNTIIIARRKKIVQVLTPVDGIDLVGNKKIFSVCV